MNFQSVCSVISFCLLGKEALLLSVNKSLNSHKQNPLALPAIKSVLQADKAIHLAALGASKAIINMVDKILLIIINSTNNTGFEFQK